MSGTRQVADAGRDGAQISDGGVSRSIAPGHPAITTSSPRARSQHAHGGATILIAEDSATQAEQLRVMLTSAGYTVLLARGGGAEALAIAKSQRPALILSDIVMPEMDGYALCRAVKSDPELAPTPVMLVTELGSPADVLEGLGAGADNFLIKPPDEAQLLSRVGYLLDNRALRGNAGEEPAIEVEFAGQRHAITAARQQILDLLISTYDQAVALSDRLNLRQQELLRSYERLNALYDFAEALNACSSEAEVVFTAARRALALPGVRASWIYLRDGSRYRLAALEGIAYGLAEQAVELCGCQRALLDGTLQVAANRANCDWSRPGAKRAHEAHAAVPLSVAGETLGLLNLAGPDEGFGDADLRMLTGVGRQVATALARARLLASLERKVEERTADLQLEIAERRQAEEAARVAEHRLMDAIESIGEGFALFDAGDRLRLCNGPYRALRAAIADRLVPGVSFAELAEALAPGMDPVSRARRQARIDQHRRADGVPLIERQGDRWLMLCERRTREGGVVVVLSDVTELRKADRAKDEFVSMVSHELRTPLTSIRGALAILTVRENAMPPAAAPMIDIATRNCDGLLRVIDDLLDVERIRSGMMRLEIAPVELSTVIVRAVETCREYARQNGVAIAVEDRSEGAVVAADAGRIAQAMTNLISNAVKFSPPARTVMLEAQREGAMVRISVTDHGPGVPASFRNAIFKEFAQADSSATRKKGGTGLGLSITRTIVEAHGGRIDYTSTEGAGATFFIDLPLAAEAAADGPERPPAFAT